MLLYQLTIKKLIDYLEIGQPTEEELRLMKLLNKKPKKVTKIRLETDKTLEFYISILLAIINVLLHLSIPFALLENPSDIFQERGYPVLHSIAKVIENNREVLDYYIVVLIVMVIYVSTKCILDGIKRTKIDISPWIQEGKYAFHPNPKRNPDPKTQQYLINRDLLQ